MFVRESQLESQQRIMSRVQQWQLSRSCGSTVCGGGQRSEGQKLDPGQRVRPHWPNWMSDQGVQAHCDQHHLCKPKGLAQTLPWFEGTAWGGLSSPLQRGDRDVHPQRDSQEKVRSVITLSNFLRFRSRLLKSSGFWRVPVPVPVEVTTFNKLRFWFRYHKIHNFGPGSGAIMTPGFWIWDG